MIFFISQGLVLLLLLYLLWNLVQHLRIHEEEKKLLVDLKEKTEALYQVYLDYREEQKGKDPSDG